MLPAPSHSTVKSEASTTSGAVVSSMVNVAVVEVALPQSSVAVKVTVTAPVAPQASLKAEKSFVQDTALQLSTAIAPPWPLSHPLRSAMLPMPSHSTVTSAAATSMFGAVTSSTVMVWLQASVVVLPQ